MTKREIAEEMICDAWTAAFRYGNQPTDENRREAEKQLDDVCDYIRKHIK